MSRLSRKFLPVPFLVGACGLALGTAIGITWTKSEVVPVIIVKPGIGGFVPTEGSSIGSTWLKSEVKAVILVKPGIGAFGFFPVAISILGAHANA